MELYYKYIVAIVLLFALLPIILVTRSIYKSHQAKKLKAQQPPPRTTIARHEWPPLEPSFGSRSFDNSRPTVVYLKGRRYNFPEPTLYSWVLTGLPGMPALEGAIVWERFGVGAEAR